MRNGIRFNSTDMNGMNKNGMNKLKLVDNSQETEDDPAAYFPYQPDHEAVPAGGKTKNLFLVFLTLSITCAAATVVTGSYAVWLARQQAAHQALTDVNDILRSCQSRMSQLEGDLQRLPNRQA